MSWKEEVMPLARREARCVAEIDPEATLYPGMKLLTLDAGAHLYMQGYAAARPRWVQCYEGYPALGQRVLVHVHDAFEPDMRVMFLIAKKKGGGMCWAICDDDDGAVYELADVDSWLPLPEDGEG